MKHSKALFIVWTAILPIAGCASSGPQLPKYVPPQLPPEQLVTVHGHGGTNITAIDQAEVRGSGVQMGNFGGNKVVLTPGHHRIVISVATSSANTFSKGVSAVECDFQAGHTYKVGPSNMFSFNRRPILVDETTG